MSNKKAGMIAGAVLMFILALPSCAPYHARHKPVKYSDTGIASWYGPGFAGRKTANGERFNPNALTAAHRKLPFGTSVKVTNLSNDKSIVVRINDRGPFIRGRIIDLSKRAAQKIGLTKTGTAKVKVVALNVGQSKEPQAKRKVIKKIKIKEKIKETPTKKKEVAKIEYDFEDEF